MKIENRFLKYVSIDTQSDPYSSSTPSTEKQLELAEFLSEEMKILGLKNVYKDDFGVVYGTIPASDVTSGDRIGFIAHMDTSPDAPGHNINPQIIRDYDGGIITINEEKKMYLDPDTTPELNTLIHHDLITTDGTTLLGADDKAGIAIIMTMAEYMFRHPEFKHQDISIAFTPDEEVGRGTENFDIKRFDADYAYTVDGGDINEYNFENFNAYKADITIKGQSFHTGDAKGKMVNALTIARKLEELIGDNERPEHTEGYEGFYHLGDMSGDVSHVNMHYIIRNHDTELINEMLMKLTDHIDYLNKQYGYKAIEVTYTKQYENMKNIISKYPNIVEQVETAMLDLGMHPTPSAIRGGTDGARLSFMGLPTPNLGTGGYNYHGEYEFVSLTDMKKAVNLLLRIIKNNMEGNIEF